MYIHTYINTYEQTNKQAVMKSLGCISPLLSTTYSYRHKYPQTWTYK